jgi:hypothetical protein
MNAPSTSMMTATEIHAHQYKDETYSDGISHGCSNRMSHAMTAIYLLMPSCIKPPSKSPFNFFFIAPVIVRMLDPFGRNSMGQEGVHSTCRIVLSHFQFLFAMYSHQGFALPSCSLAPLIH